MINFKQYIKLANLLDSLRHYGTADRIDKLINAQTNPVPKGVQKLHTNNLYHIRWPHGKEIANKGPGFKNTEELDKEFPLTFVLRPRIPGVDSKREDATTPRVSFAITLGGACGSLGLGQINGPFYIGIYKPAQAIDVYVPFSGEPPENKSFYVHDAAAHGEVWALRPVTVELQKIIRPEELIKL